MVSKINEFLLISANIGSTFDFPDRMFPTWINNVALTVQHLEPLFIAIHCQEVGGKNYEESMQYVDNFIKLLLKNPSLACYDKARIYLDEDFTIEEKFTALGSLYFIHESVINVQQWDFNDNKFIPVESRELFSANIEHVPHKFKEKFPLDFFPEQKWSRKGFIHTRWKILDIVMDFVNIHLFHDICNLAPIIKDSKTYSSCRSRALDYTLKKVTNGFVDSVPLFIFGDFNFRLTTEKLIKQLVEPKATIEKVLKKSQGKLEEIRKIVYRKHDLSVVDSKINHNESVQNGFCKDDKLLEVGRKTFDMTENSNWFVDKFEMFRVFDEEPQPFLKHLHEFPVTFPPSYPFSEHENEPKNYMKTRCPSWCDRIFLNDYAKILILSNTENPVKYEMIGLDSCVGDHKPIYLSFHINPVKIGDNCQLNNNVISEDDFCNSNSTAIKSSEQITNESIINGQKSMNGNSAEVSTSPFSNNNGSQRRLFNSVVSHDFNRGKRHSIVDAINGLRASVDTDKCSDMWNIFDNSRFDKETELDINFRLSHRPYTGLSCSVDQLSITQSNNRNIQSLFIQAARQITVAENVISAFRQSINRKRKISDSSSENDADEDKNRQISCNDVIIESNENTPIINNTNATLSQDVPHKTQENAKKLNQKISCCTIS